MTRLQEHKEQVRKRLNRTIRYVELPSIRRPREDAFTVFANRMVIIARKRDEWPWKQKATNLGGAPKDLPSSLRRFSRGESGLTSRVLRLVELACIDFETEHLAKVSDKAIAQQDAVREIASIGSSVRIPPTVAGATEPDDEINAMREISLALDGFDSNTTARILRWAVDKYGSDAE